MSRSSSAVVVRSDDCLLHVPGAEIWVGVSTPGTELPERATRIGDALRRDGHRFVDAAGHSDDVLLRVHDPRLVEHLRTVWSRWVDAGFPVEPGQDRVVPYLMPTAVHAAAGRYCYDTMTLVGPGTWLAARAAVDVTLSAVDLVTGGEPVADALVRPPGHHVTRAAYGGSCYLNNAGIAAQALDDAGHERVAIVDIDAHHGNGTQALFYDRADVLYASLHVDPGAGWFPHYAGFADETGRGAGLGANLNVPLAEGTPDEPWLAAVDRIAEAVDAHGATALVVSLGVDAAAADPESPLQVTHDGYEAAGRRLAALGLPTVAVQEGGYHLDTLGDLVSRTLAGLADR